MLEYSNINILPIGKLLQSFDHWLQDGICKFLSEKDVHYSLHKQSPGLMSDVYLLAVVKVPILQHLESLRDEELEERREKRRRQQAEEEEAKQNERRASGAEEAREQSLQV